MNHLTISCIIRGLQSIFVIVVLGMSATILGTTNGLSGRVPFNLATSIINLVYFVYILVVLPTISHNRVIPSPIIFCEIIMTFLWVVAFGLVAAGYGSATCTIYTTGPYDDDETTCKLGKGLIGVGIINALLFLVSTNLFYFYTMRPLLIVANVREHPPINFIWGAIFPGPPSRPNNGNPKNEENVNLYNQSNNIEIQNNKFPYNYIPDTNIEERKSQNEHLELANARNQL
ncbi:membrane-associating domain-containing protein [Scheffersomyces coipomensis]|uniref:membrane-associating domain-containing protein n=1 Tax=Scheffersomyces coipomensis TaxID=1788519 RepID=UPI00315D3B75